jgi:hypothetical protein
MCGKSMICIRYRAGAAAWRLPAANAPLVRDPWFPFAETGTSRRAAPAGPAPRPRSR